MEMGSFSFVAVPLERGRIQYLSGSGEYGLGRSFGDANAAPKRQVPAEPAPVGPFFEPMWIAVQAGNAGARLA